ncbi:MAG: hypothetical protein DLM69_04715, partial [Candidatus Chloroheliales bacterium]
TTLGELQRWWNDPRRKGSAWWLARWLNPDRDEGAILADADFEYKPGEEQAFSGFFVHRDYRNHGIGKRLYGLIEQAAAQQPLARLYSGGPQAYTLRQEFLARRGFEFDRYFWRMRLPADKAVPAPLLPEGYTVRAFVRGQDEELFMNVRNISFAEHFGSTPYTPETAAYLIQQEMFQPEGLFFAFKGDEAAGYCWSAVSAEENARRKVSVGWIEHLGTVPGHRGVGLGRALLLIGIQHLRQRVSVVELGVEGKNANALRLYESVGFYQESAWANMVKNLNKESNGDR